MHPLSGVPNRDTWLSVLVVTIMVGLHGLSYWSTGLLVKWWVLVLCQFFGLSAITSQTGYARGLVPHQRLAPQSEV